MKFVAERTGNLFDSEAEVLGHGVNVKGVMGAGIAAQFKIKYPDMYVDYKEYCDKGLFRPGTVQIVDVEPNRFIANIASQDSPGANARYSWLTMALTSLYSGMWNTGRSDWTVALPQIGCGIGGLDWDIVKSMITDVAECYEIKTELWTWGL